MPLPTDRYITFEVTEDDIARGAYGASVCPIARAINRATTQFTLVGWIGADIYWGDTKKVTANYSKRVAVKYSHRYMDWVRAFDQGLPVRPFTGVIERDR